MRLMLAVWHLETKMLKILNVFLVLMIALLEYKIWVGKDSVFTVNKTKHELHAKQLETNKLEIRNKQAIAQIINLKKYPEAIEEQAREELGLVKMGEKYYQIVEPIK